MCCGGTEVFELPAEVIETIAGYRRLQAKRGNDWGEEGREFVAWASFAMVGQVLGELASAADWAGAVRAVLAADLPAGVVVVRVDADRSVRARTGPPRLAIENHSGRVDVVIDSAVGSELRVLVAGRAVVVEPCGVALATAQAVAPVTVEFDGTALTLDGVIEVAAAARLRLTSTTCARWSVTDATGGAWFPPGVLHKWDFHGRPFFHGHDMTVPVPATSLTVACTRGLEFDRTEVAVHPGPGQSLTVEGEPARLFDPAAEGWYGGDLHVHLNYSGDLVCEPADAIRMQHGEGLHLMNLLAGNFTRSLVYDRELFERTVGADLPWSTEDAVARMGVEYRNDLLGHVHALGPGGPPSRYQTGHEDSDHPYDWPPNHVACAELRDLGATVGYAHPAWSSFPADGRTDGFFARPRSVEARELVVDAALGVVDSIDVISPFHHEGAIYLYHRLLSCGLRLAATAGTDVFLSFSRLPLAANPPGWGRVYADLAGADLSVEAFKQAIRAGRTMVTNGPWLTLDVDGHRPGTVLDLTAGDRLTVRATVTGPGVESLQIVGPDGVLADSGSTDSVQAEILLTGPMWVAAVARGRSQPRTLDSSVLAHTSPVYVDVAGQRVARAADARWCLDLLDTLEAFIAEHGRCTPAQRQTQLDDFTTAIEQARAYYRGRITG